MSSRKFGLNLVIVMAIAALFTGFWALINRPVSAPDWPEQISGFSYSPFRLGESPQKGQYPTEAEMREDLEQLSKLTDSIRTYTVEGTQAEIPRLAEEFGLRVTLGVWISPDQERNEREIEKAIELANTTRSVVRVVVGNEALFREEITPEALIVYLDRVRAAVKVPVTTSEQWHIWEKNPQLAKHVDLIAAHILPYWEFIPMKDAGQFVLDRARDLSACSHVNRCCSRKSAGRATAACAAVPTPPRPTRRSTCAPWSTSSTARATTTSSSKPTTSRGRPATKARWAPTGACSTLRGSRNSTSKARWWRSRNGGCWRWARWSWRCCR